MSNIYLNKKLGDTIGIKSENLHLMRFVAAIMVIFSHSFFISTGSETGEWFRTLTNDQLTMGNFAVSIFFLCGGYLIAMSAEKHKTAQSYFAARIKRLFPSLFFVTVLTVILCGLISTWGPVSYVLSVDSWKYLLNAVFIRVRELPGVFVSNASSVVNGSYWTLPVEFACYIICFIAYKISFLKEKRFPVGIVFVIIGMAFAWKYGSVYPVLRELIRPVLLFYIGMGYWVYREHIMLNVRNFVVSIVTFILLVVLGQGQIAMLLAFPYMMMYIWFGMKQCSSRLGKLGNYSYGIYLWGFTVQQIVMHYWPDKTMNPLINMLIATPISIILGIVTYEIIENETKGIPEWVKKLKCPHVIYVVLLVVYALRHVDLGLDLWDTGYSYSNFQYLSFEHMDSMWIFSTYLANVVGNLLTKLPLADSLIGMNVYTTLFIAALAVIGYFFCSRKLNMTRWVAFIGVFIALTLSWCPSSVLYNYLTYLLVILCAILLYKGLTQEKKWWLFAAGVCLGANILTRFSNLPQAALILAVWAYDFIESRERQEKGAFKRTINHTLWCLGGYLAGFGTFLGYIHIRYGIGEYIQGIIRLFSMTEVAEGYKPNSMVSMVIQQYLDEIPWVIELISYVLVGMVIWFGIELIKKHIKPVRECKWLQNVLQVVGIASSVYLTYLVIERLYYGAFCLMNYFTYDSILGPAVVFMLLTIGIVVVKVIHKEVRKEEKLIGIIIVLLLLINSLGSSNGVFSSFNNLFLAAPYTLWNCYKFIRYEKSNYAWPAKCVLIGYLFVFFCQSIFFGEYFFFTEAGGAQNTVATVDNNEVLDGIKMNPDKAAWLTSISKYAKENDLYGKEVILFGNIPSLSYYLQMPPAFNSWPDLGSYNITQMTLDIEELQSQMDVGEVEAPVVIIDSVFVPLEGNAKLDLIKEFMEKNGYECTFYNGKFSLFEVTITE